MNAELQAELQASVGWLIALSVSLIVLGIAAIVMPGIASVTCTLVWVGFWRFRVLPVALWRLKRAIATVLGIEPLNA